MRKWVVVAGLIILLIGAFPMIPSFLGLGARLDSFPAGESRLPILMVLPLVLGIILMIAGVALPSSKKEGNGFRMGYWQMWSTRALG